MRRFRSETEQERVERVLTRATIYLTQFIELRQLAQRMAGGGGVEAL